MAEVTSLDIAQAAFIAALVMDWHQTRTIARNPDKWHEYNIILGKHPTPAAVDRYFAIALLLQLALVHQLPDDVALKFAAGAAVFEGLVVARNYKIGLR